MNYQVKAEESRPAYLQLYEQLREDIAAGVYAYGERLPSKRLIAAEAGVSLITVEHMYELLLEEGYAEARERSGFFACYREEDLYARHAVQCAAAPAMAVQPAYVNTGRDFPFPMYAKTVRRVLSEYGERLFIKEGNAGSEQLRQALVAYLARSRGIRVRPGQVVVGAGSEYLYSLIVQLFSREKYIAIEDPSYEMIAKVYEANGLQCEPLRMGEEGILSEALAGARARLLHVTPYDSYPSGITAAAGKRAEYVRWAAEREGYIIEDDFDSEFSFSARAKDTVFGMAQEGRVIYLNTFSHTIAPSVRIGYMILPAELLEAFTQRLGFYSCTVPLLEQYVLAELLNSGDFERHINRVRRRLRRGDGKQVAAASEKTHRG
ncbi:MAG: PLP-dependent aminotransferase family protein [Lachnospiraceae bacterium]|nr:PLP-dependent aminotransferase family protein [Lachnospiraceae bacterium]